MSSERFKYLEVYVVLAVAALVVVSFIAGAILF